MGRSGRQDRDALISALHSQHHVLTRAQALAAGMTLAALRHRLRPDGPWRVLLPGIYVAHGGTATVDQRDMAALLYAGPDSVITGHAALRRHHLGGAQASVVDVLAPVSVQRRSCGFVRVQRSGRVPGRVYRDGEIRFAEVARAVAGAARTLNNAREVTALVALAVQRRQRAIHVAGEIADGPVRGSALLRRALEEVSNGIRSVAEADFRGLILRARLYEGANLLAVVDAWWPEAGVAGEVDSREWHLSPQDWERTMRRHAELGARGLVVLHFSPRRLKTEPDRVAATVRAALAAAMASGTQPRGGAVQARPALG